MGESGPELCIQQCQALDGREHGDRRSDHAVTIEQAGTKDADEHDGCSRLWFKAAFG
jgi:hypothetical protein